MRPIYSNFYFKHLLFCFEPNVLVLPIVLWIDETGIQIGMLWFSMIWFWKEQED